jgi:hypothetical protein
LVAAVPDRLIKDSCGKPNSCHPRTAPDRCIAA